MRFIDISLPLSNKTIAHPKEPKFSVEPQRTLEKNGVATSKIVMAAHFGTHLDAPAHFIVGGKGVDELDLTKLTGPCQVLDLMNVTKMISKSDIEGKIKSQRVLFKTMNSELLTKPYTKDYISLAEDTAEYLIEQNVDLVGTDYIAIEASGSPGHPVHTKLLENEVVIVEGCNLAGVEPGDYELIVLPLKLSGLDGSPARAVLIQR